MPRFIAALFDPGDQSAARRVAAGTSLLRNADARWRAALSSEDGVLLTYDRVRAFRTHELSDGGGAVFGAVFRRGAPSRAVGAFDAAETARIRDTEGAWLPTAVWGGYLALVRGRTPGSWSILRDPSGAVPVYHAYKAGVHLLFSDLVDALAFDPPALEVNWRVLSCLALAPNYQGRDTAVEGVTRVPAGSRLVLDVRRPAGAIEACWRPADIVGARRLEDPERAAEELYAAVLDTVQAWSSLFDNIVLTLSGGLDSSIIAGALHETGRTAAVTCLNLYPGEDLLPAGRLDGRGALRGDLSSLGDERAYARSMAERCGYPIVERPRSVANMDLGLLAAAPLTAKPSAYVLGLDTDLIFGEVSAEVGAEAIFGGDGGDASLGATGDLLTALDAVAHYGLSRRSLAAMCDAAKLSGRSFWRVLATALQYRLTGRVRGAQRQDEDAQRALLSDPDGIPSYEDRLRGSWCVEGELPPGKDRHAWFTEASIGAWRDDPLALRIDHIHPLLSQPVVETTLQIPSYVLCRYGVSRSLARQTFSRLLTPLVYNRRQKATGLNLQQRLVLSNLSFIKEALLDGALVRHNVLHRTKLEAALASEAELRKDSSRYMLYFLSAEFWLRSLERERSAIQSRRVA